ncbi:MAG: type II toxin-antitoxin system VapC family toxin [Solirubrobacterales bacterium]|nr:type II toxin-antitoxin system VapC family toxin [Solirubrobacterales bacterium]
MIILDTNVVSELMRAEPSPAVLSWVSAQDATALSTTAVTVAEISYGIQRLPAGRRRQDIAAAASEVFDAFASQILAFDRRAAELYATVVTDRERKGRPIDGFDAQIAAICRTSSAILATRNTVDFADTGLSVVNPWQAAST